MNQTINLSDIKIRNHFEAGDIGYVIYAHAELYKKEFQYGLGLETYVAKGMIEFYENFDPKRSRIWVCEHEGKRIGFLALIDRGETAQFRYFFFHPNYRGIGLGRKLMDLYMDFCKKVGYKSSYLLTTVEQEKAAKLYRGYGFKVVEEFDSTAFDKALVEQRYELVF